MGFLKSAVIKNFSPETWRKLTRYKDELTTGFKRESYSQEGEDLVLSRIFEGKLNGFYIDVGAYHPKRFSNTYVFYLKGWRGINIDACPGSMDAFKKKRPRDINLEIGIASSSGVLEYFHFDEPALNGFSSEMSVERNEYSEFKIIKTSKVKVDTLEHILDQYLPKNQPIDFISIDAEGLDEVVILSNNWEKYRPGFVLVEILDWHSNHPIDQLMELRDYSFFAKTVNTIFYRNNRNEGV